jgi:hypothetical protein
VGVAALKGGLMSHHVFIGFMLKALGRYWGE